MVAITQSSAALDIDRWAASASAAPAARQAKTLQEGEAAPFAAGAPGASTRVWTPPANAVIMLPRPGAGKGAVDGAIGDISTYATNLSLAGVSPPGLTRAKVDAIQKQIEVILKARGITAPGDRKAVLEGAQEAFIRLAETVRHRALRGQPGYTTESALAAGKLSMLLLAGSGEAAALYVKDFLYTRPGPDVVTPAPGTLATPYTALTDVGWVETVNLIGTLFSGMSETEKLRFKEVLGDVLVERLNRSLYAKASQATPANVANDDLKHVRGVLQALDDLIRAPVPRDTLVKYSDLVKK